MLRQPDAYLFSLFVRRYPEPEAETDSPLGERSLTSFAIPFTVSLRRFRVTFSYATGDALSCLYAVAPWAGRPNARSRRLFRGALPSPEREAIERCPVSAALPGIPSRRVIGWHVPNATGLLHRSHPARHSRAILLVLFRFRAGPVTAPAQSNRPRALLTGAALSFCAVEHIKKALLPLCAARKFSGLRKSLAT